MCQSCLFVIGFQRVNFKDGNFFTKVILKILSNSTQKLHFTIITHLGLHAVIAIAHIKVGIEQTFFSWK